MFTTDKKNNRNLIIQPKLTIGQPNDKYENEADQIADEIMKMPETPTLAQRKKGNVEEEEELQMKPLSSTITPIVQKQESKEVEKREMVQTKTENGFNNNSPSLEDRLKNSKGKGQRLPNETLGFMNQSFGNDFTNVKTHTDSMAVQMNQELGAKAFTNGNDIYFNRNEFNPTSNTGKNLLAHELTHTIQQSNNSSNPKIQKYSNFSITSDLAMLGEISWSTETPERITILEGGIPLKYLAKDIYGNEDLFIHFSFIGAEKEEKTVSSNTLLTKGQIVRLNYQFLKPELKSIYNNGINIKDRKSWEANPHLPHSEERSYEKYTRPLENIYHSIAIHHSGNKGYDNMKDVQKLHIEEKERADIGYHFGVDLEGNIFEGRPIGIKGSHVEKANTGVIGIILLADLDEQFFEDDDEITRSMESSLLKLVHYLIGKYPKINYLGGHKDFNADRTCPGNLAMEKIENWIAETGLRLPLKNKEIEEWTGIMIKNESIEGTTSGFYGLRSEPSTSSSTTFKFGILSGENKDVKVIDKTSNDGYKWYQIEFKDKSYLQKIVGKDSIDSENITALQMFKTGRAWVIQKAITTIVSYEQFLLQLREFEKIYSHLTITERLTKLRQISHPDNLPFDQVIGSNVGNYYENQRPDLDHFYQILKEGKAIRLLNNEVIDIYHFIVGLEALQPEKRKLDQSITISEEPVTGFPIWSPISINISDRATIDENGLTIKDVGASYNATTWSGDIGAGAANKYVGKHEDYEKQFTKEEKEAKEKNKFYDLESRKLDHYFDSMASEADLKADIDAWGAYDLVSSSQISSVEEIIANYYGSINLDNKLSYRKNAIINFLNHFGFTSSKNLSSQKDQVDYLTNQIENFAYVWIWRVDPSERLSEGEKKSLYDDSRLMAIKFLDWLEELAGEYDVKLTN